jgi:hypothetical protein
VNRLSTIVLAGVLLAGSVSVVTAGSFKYESVADPDGRASYVLSTLHIMGLDRISQPARRGPYYIMHAYDPLGVEVRVVADAEFGDILSIAVADVLNYPPLYVREPRIIHVPQPDDPDVTSSTPPAAPPHKD